MILKDKKILITGILTDKSIAYASAQVAIENGAQVVATGFGKGLRITERAVKRLSDDIQVYEMDIQNPEQVETAMSNIKDNFGNLDGILHAIAFSPTEAMGGNFMNTTVEDALTSFEVSAFSLSETQVLGMPAVIRPLGAAIEKIYNGKTGFIANDESQFVEYSTRILSDLSFFNRMYEESKVINKLRSSLIYL